MHFFFSKSYMEVVTIDVAFPYYMRDLGIIPKFL
jgi:hypothetical protein